MYTFNQKPNPEA